jgi:DNA-binding transcriptional MocR family regulator
MWKVVAIGPYDRLMQVDRDVGNSLRDQCADQLRDEIGAGYRPGDALPSERQLAKRLGVGRDVIRDALQELRNEGLVVTTPGMTHRVRPVGEPHHVVLLPGDTAVARMPSGPERRRLRLDRGTPIVEILRGGSRVALYTADGLRLEAAASEGGTGRDP